MTTTMKVRVCSVADIEAAPELLAAYDLEVGMPELGSYRPDFGRYHAMEKSGWLTCIGAFHEDKLVGILNVLAGPNPHLGSITASAESFFVVPEWRESGAGMALLAMAESIANGKGAMVLFVSAKAGSTLARVMRGKHSYKPSNEVFCKVLI